MHKYIINAKAYYENISEERTVDHMKMLSLARNKSISQKLKSECNEIRYDKHGHSIMMYLTLPPNSVVIHLGLGSTPYDVLQRSFS